MSDMKLNRTAFNSSREDENNKMEKFFAIEREAGNFTEVTLANLHSGHHGLTQSEAAARLNKYGRNETVGYTDPSVVIQLLLSFNNPFIYLLMVLALVSLITDYWLPLRAGQDTDLSGVIIISVMVMLSGLMSFWQTFRTRRAAQILQPMVRIQVTVLRRAHEHARSHPDDIDSSELVPGDVILLNAGDRVPADIRLLTSRNLFIDQAMLTGESSLVAKSETHRSEQAQQQGLLQSGNTCLMGTFVASGTASAIVVATGGQTYFASLICTLSGRRPQTAFDRGVNSVSLLLIRMMLVMVPVVMLINGLTKGNWMDAALFALAVGVGLTPEMLPMIVSANLAKGAVAMSRRKVIVKRLNAIQNLGAMDVLCTDKTGTLTQHKIQLTQYVNCAGKQDNRLLLLAWLNSSCQSGTKNPMDRAVLELGEQILSPMQRNEFHLMDELPFDFVRRRMSVLVENLQCHQSLLICKGAVQEILMVATSLRLDHQVIPLSEARRAELLTLTQDYHQQGFRVLLLATRQQQVQQPLGSAAERDLVIEGILTFNDPAKESAGKAIQALGETGISVKVLTGDNPSVTLQVCQQIGLPVQTMLTGDDIAAMDDATLAREVERCTLFTRLMPLQKSRILRQLQQNGHTVGFLGDGINDAPALRNADVGISVDSASDIAKESSDIILLEKDLKVLCEGVITGRETFGNILKYLNMTASSNFGNVFSLLVASAFLPFLPMLSIHLLLQNLMYDMSQLALPWDKMDREFLRQPRKWDASNIRRFMFWLGPTSSIFDITTFALMWYVFAANHIAVQALFQSGWFVEGLLSQTLVVHMLRTQKIPFIQSRAAWPVMLTRLSIMALGMVIPFSPLGAMIGLVPLPWHYFPWLAITLLSYCLVAQGMKMYYIKRFGRWF